MIEPIATIHLYCISMRKATWIVLTKQAFGIILKRERLSRKISQEKLAADTGLHPTYIRRLEKGICVPSLKTVVLIYRGMGILPIDFINIFDEELIKLESEEAK